MATQGLKQGCPLSPLLYALFTNDLGKFLNTSDHGAMTALQTAEVSHCEYADDIALTTITAHQLQEWREWKDLDQIHPHDAHASSRVMTTYRTHFGVPIWSQPGCWDDQKRATKSTLPSYLRHNIPNHLSRALSRLRLSGHNLNVERLRQQQHRVPYELRICT